VDWNEFFEQQRGGAYYFEGQPWQRGGGIGSIFQSLVRFLMPIGKTIGRELGKEGIETGSRLLNRLAAGQDIKSSMVEESQKGLKNLVDRVYEKRQSGGRRAIKGKKKTIVMAKIRPSKKADYFGTF
jgi:hypothetical protein